MSSVFYYPSGRAEEYSEGLALNIYLGCTNACDYCYNSKSRFSKPDYFLCAKPRKDILERVTKDAPEIKGKSVFLSFMSDAYQDEEEKLMLTRLILFEFLKNDIKPIILTKNKLVIRDFDLIKKCGGKVGTTLTHIDKIYSQIEPHSSTPEERIEILKLAKEKGIETFVSLEPIIDLHETLDIIDKTHQYTDFYKVGRWNHDEEANHLDWKNVVKSVVEHLTNLDKKFMVKKELKKYLNE